MEYINQEIPHQRKTQYTYSPHFLEPKGEIPIRGNYFEEINVEVSALRCFMSHDFILQRFPL